MTTASGTAPDPIMIEEACAPFKPLTTPEMSSTYAGQL